MAHSRLCHYCSLFTLLMFVGCSSSSDSANSDSSSGDSQASAPDVSAPAGNAGGPDAMDPAATPDDAMNAMSGPSAGMMAMGGNAGPQIMTRQAVPRPADPNEWNSQHITAAVEERDLKVIPALTAYAGQHQGEDQSAQEVVAWLQLLNEPPVNVANPIPGGSAPGGRGYSSPAGEGYGGYGTAGSAGGHGDPAATPDPAAFSAGSGPGGGHGDPAAAPDPAAFSAGSGPGGGHGDPAAAPDPAAFSAGSGPGEGHGDPAAVPDPAAFSAGSGPGGGHGGAADATDPALFDEGMYEEGMTPGTAGGQRNQPSANNDARIAAALIDTLMAIHSLTSYQAARDLLEGNLKLPFAPERTAGWTMISLIKHVDGAHDPAAKILRQTIQQPDLIRKGSGDFDASRLKELALQEHWTSALAVVDGLMGLRSRSLSAPARQNRNNNYAGEGYAAEGEIYDPAMTEGADVYAGGFPGAQNNQPQGDNPKAVNPIPKNLALPDFSQEEALAARHYLWSPELVNEVAQRLSESETLMKDPPLLLLAGQLPTTPTRYAFQQFLEKNWLMNDDWTRNPSSLIRYDVFSKYLRDPGLTVTLKHLPREQQVSANNNAGGEYGGAYEGAGPQPNNNRQQNQDPEKQREQQIKHLWFETSEKFTLALMDRMLAAARGQHLPESNLEEIEIRLHRNASITIGSRLELALGEASADPEQAPRDKTTVNYIRIESSELGPRDANHYKTVLRQEKQFMILNNNGMWLSAPVDKDRKTGELVSIDVLLSRNNARPPVGGGNQQQPSNDIANLAPGTGGGGNQTFVIEILVVRVPDPEIFLQQPEQAVSAK